ncbi:MAG: type II secretion system F family protein, partial [Armatimonadetes bacterium]|nr:type II secretion system F family protein [Armatimonadota bacterium]
GSGSNSSSARAEARLPADQALAAARKTLGGAVSAIAVRAEAAVREGKSLASALAELELLPEPTLARLKAAEGKSLPATLTAISAEHLDLADFYARRFVTILEPTIVIVVGLMVMAFAVALFGPLVRIIQTLGALTS